MESIEVPSEALRLRSNRLRGIFDVTFESWLSNSHSDIPTPSALAVLSLASEGATVPFIARYRKEKTGNLDEVAIQAVLDAKEKWDLIEHRKKFILEQIEQQNKLTPELKEKIQSTFQLELLDDLYLPYKQKRKSKAAQAREAGLEPLADWIWNCAHGTETPQPGQTLDLWAFTFRNEKAGINDAAAAIEGASYLLIERLSETSELRQFVRQEYFEKGMVRASKAEKAKTNSKFEPYFNHEEPVSSLLQPKNSHRYLAIRRGWIEEELALALGGAAADPEFENRLETAFSSAAISTPGSPGHEVLVKAARLALKAHVIPSIENEVHKALKDVADDVAIRVFSENVRKLLLASPLGPKTVMGADPGIRTGCKLAVVDASGKHMGNAVIHLQSEAEKLKAKTLITELLKNTKIDAIAVGNGTAGRETEALLRSIIKDASANVPVVMVSEAGASVYSASDVAREEFPDLDITVRGAVSIARRLQDPLAELVKVDPKSIGVGQYQHDVSQPALKRSLDQVVDSCVNSVGVNLNTASSYLLSRVSGIGESLAKAIVAYREEKGLFKNRSQLLDIPRFSKKTFEQAAGFLRVEGSDQPLDNTGVHPERYEALESWAKRAGKQIKDLLGKRIEFLKKDTALRNELGEFTFEDTIRELEKPGRDPRDPFVAFSFRDDIFNIKDLKPGMICPGIVTNVTSFGAFVDIGVHQDGLVHISRLSEQFVANPRDAVSPGDRVTVKVLEANLEKGQISLTIRGATEQARPARPKQREEDAPRQKQSPQRHTRPHSTPKPQRPPRPAFTNNPFASLAALKKDLKR